MLQRLRDVVRQVQVAHARRLVDRLTSGPAARAENWGPFAMGLLQRQLSPDQLRRASLEMLRSTLPADLWPLLPGDKRNKPVMNTWTYQNEIQQWDIRDEEVVLDVGSGGWPFKRANHLADKYPEQTTHRTEAIARDDRPFHQVDLHALPFTDKAYDFVFCSHVLEHLDDPGRAIRELTRVGRRGYLEVPTRLSDVMFNFTRLPEHHRWHGLVLGRTLVLMEWNDRERRELGNDFFNALQSEYDNAFQHFFERNRDLFFASLQWQDRIDFMVIGKDGRVLDRSEDAR